MAKKKSKRGKRHATSKTGRHYTKHPKTGKWVEVKSYHRHGPHKHKRHARKHKK